MIDESKFPDWRDCSHYVAQESADETSDSEDFDDEPYDEADLEEAMAD